MAPSQPTNRNMTRYHAEVLQKEKDAFLYHFLLAAGEAASRRAAAASPTVAASAASFSAAVAALGRRPASGADGGGAVGGLAGVLGSSFSRHGGLNALDAVTGGAKHGGAAVEPMRTLVFVNAIATCRRLVQTLELLGVSAGGKRDKSIGTRANTVLQYDCAGHVLRWLT